MTSLQPDSSVARRSDMRLLIVLTVLPLALIVGQIVAGTSGPIGYSLYKIAFLLPPIVYCRWQGIGIFRDILKFRHGRNGLLPCLLLGLAAAGIFAGAYAAWSDRLLDEAKIIDKIDSQLGVDRSTVLLIAPFTIVLNSLLEEFFYRGFSFGRLVRHHPLVAYLLPAAVFTAQHVLFIYHWVGLFPLCLAIVSLFVFSILLEWLYLRYDTIVAPWVVHVGGDVAMMGIAVMLLYGRTPAG